MQTLVHADIFFFISSIALIVLSILLSIALYYAIGVLRAVREVSSRLKRASADIEHDLQLLRSQVKAEGQRVKGMADLFLGFIARASTPKAVRRKRAAKSEVEVEEEDL